MEKNLKKHYFHILIMFVLAFGIGLLPPFGQITEIGMRVLGCFIAIVYGWIFIDLLWVSFFGFALLTFTGFTTATNAFIEGFGNASFLMCLLSAVFAECLNQIGVTEGIAYWLLSKKIFIGKPLLLILAVCSCAFLMGLANGGIAAVFLLWTVILKVGELSGYQAGSRITNMLIAFVVYISITVTTLVPFYGGCIFYGSFLTKGTGLIVPSGPMMISGMIYMVLTIAVMLLISKYLLKIEMSHYTTTPELCEEYAKYQMNRHQKTGLALLGAYFAVLLLPELFPNLPGANFSKSLGVIGWTIIYAVVFIIWKKPDGQPIVKIGECFKNLPWSMLILMAVTFPLATALESADTGVVATITSTVTPYLTKMNITTLLIVVMIFLGVITQIMHNIVMAAIFIPIIPAIVIQMGGNPYVCFFMMYVALSCAFVTPAASWMAGLVFGNETMKKKDAYLFGTVFLVATIIVTICMIPLLNILFAY